MERRRFSRRNFMAVLLNNVHSVRLIKSSTLESKPFLSRNFRLSQAKRTAETLRIHTELFRANGPVVKMGSENRSFVKMGREDRSVVKIDRSWNPTGRFSRPMFTTHFHDHFQDRSIFTTHFQDRSIFTTHFHDRSPHNSVRPDIGITFTTISGNTSLTSLPLVSVRCRGRVSRGKILPRVQPHFTCTQSIL